MSPARASRPCAFPNCGELLSGDETYCADHSRGRHRRINEARDAASVRLYNTKRWKRLSKVELQREPWCALCGNPAEHRDHVTPHKGNERSFWRGARQSLCRKCHSRKTLEEQRGVGGAQCTG